MLEVRNIAFGYTSEKLLRDVSFVVSPGEIVSIIGANGSGKTTLMRILATLMIPERGQILYDGRDLAQDPLRYRHLLGYLPEQVAVYDDMTVKEYLRYRAQLKGEPVKRIRRRLGEAAEMTHLTDHLRRTIKDLSQGMKKRVALADALLLRPRILLLDDFLAGLDYDFRAEIGTVLQEAASFSSVVVTGHELADMKSWTTRFLRLRGGIVTEVTV